MAKSGIELATVYLSLALSGENLGQQVGRQLSGVDRTAADAGRRAGRALAQAINETDVDLSKVRAEVDKTARAADQAARELGAAMHKQEQATLLVEQRQKELTAAVEKYGAESAQATARQRQLSDAQFKLGVEQQKVKAATDASAQASEKLTAAQKRLVDAEKGAEEGAKKAAGGINLLGGAIDRVDVKKLNDGLSKIDWNGAARGSAVVAGGIGAAFAGATKTAASFEQRMSAVKAVSGATAPELQQLHDKALQLGKDTAFSASESATAIEELVKAGLTVPQVMAGAADATVALAAASGVDMPEAATIAANAMNAFNINGDRMGHVADLIAGAANASAIDVSEFGYSLQASGAVANLVGMSFDDLSVAIAEMGNAGIKGQDAGTSLKTMLNNLQPSTKAAYNQMRDLGIITADGANRFYDAQGKLKPLREVQDILASSTKNLTAQQKQQALEVMFGSDAIRAAAVMANNGAQGYDTLATSMGKVTAAQTAADRMGNLNGQIEQMKGSIETLAITLGEKLIPKVNDGVQKVTRLVNAFLALPPDEQQKWIRLAQAIGGVAGGIFLAIKVGQGIGAVVKAYEGFSAVVSALRGVSSGLKAIEATSGAARVLQATAGGMKAVEAAKGAGTALSSFSSIGSGAASALGGLAGRIGGLFAPLSRLGGAFQVVFQVLSKHPIGLIILAVVAVGVALVTAYQKVGWFRDGVNSAFGAIRDFLKPVTDAIVNGWRVATGWLLDTWNRWAPAVSQAIAQVTAPLMAWVGWFATVFATAIHIVVVIFEIVWRLVVLGAQWLWKSVSDGFMALVGFMQAVFAVAWAVVRAIIIEPLMRAWDGIVLIWRWVTDKFTEAWNWVSAVFRGWWNQITALLEIPMRVALGALSVVWNLIRDAFSAAWNWVSTTFRPLWEQAKGIIEGPINAAKDLVLRAIDTMKAGFETGVAAIKKIWDNLGEIAKAPVRFVINTVVNDGLIDNLNKLAEAVGVKDRVARLPLPPGFRTGGYTGDVPEDQIVGPVHGREFVFDAPTVRAAGGPAEMEVLRSRIRTGAWPVGPAAATGASQNGTPETGSGLPITAIRGLPVDVRRLALDGPQPGDDDGFGGAVDWGLAQQGAMGWYRKCLAFVNAAWGHAVPRFGLYDARASMYAGPRTMEGMPPPGAGVYWKTGVNDHIALAVGDGTVLSNDIRVAGRIDRVPQQEVNKWGPYMGWWHPGNAVAGNANFDPGAGGSWFSPLQQLLGTFASPMKWIADLGGKVIDKAAGTLGGSMLAKVALGVPRFMLGKIASLSSLFGASDAGIPMDGNSGTEGTLQNPGTNVTRWAGLVAQALQASGIGGGPADIAAWLRQIWSESKGDPRLIQSSAVYDVNVANGDPARGLVQVPGVTWADFGRDMGPFLPNVYDPFKNLVVGMRAAGSQYRDWRRVIGFGHGYNIGTNYAAPGIKTVAENEIEVVTGPSVRTFAGGERVYNSRDLRSLMGDRRTPAEIKVYSTDEHRAARLVARELEWMG